MQIADFTLERYFARWEFAVRHVLCASDVEPYRLPELLALADDDCRQRWESLSLGYTESQGLPALREEIATLYDDIADDDVLTFAGAEEAVFLTMHATLGAGDHAVVAWPAYQSLYEVARSIGADVTLVPLNPADWSLDVDAVAAAMRPKTRIIVVNSPHSPTGAQLSIRATGASHVNGRVARCVAVLRRGVPLLGARRSALFRPPRRYRRVRSALGSCPKHSGWPACESAGSHCAIESLRTKLASLKDYTTICSAAPSEVLSLIALRARDRVLDRSRGIIETNLSALDAFFDEHSDRLSWVRPRAGSVCFPKLAGQSIDDFAATLVQREGVLLLPASQFGYPGNHFRLGYGRADMPQALEALGRHLRTN